MPNPSLRLDAGLALVVIEFRDDSGQVRDTIPTQAQLDAYRSWDRTKAGDPPPGMPGGGRGEAARSETPSPPPKVATTAPVPEPGETPAMGVVAQVGGPPVPVVTAPGPAPAPVSPPAPGPAPPVPATPVGEFKSSSTFAD
jgi:hypothetical protein